MEAEVHTTTTSTSTRTGMLLEIRHHIARRSSRSTSIRLSLERAVGESARRLVAGADVHVAFQEARISLADSPTILRDSSSAPKFSPRHSHLILLYRWIDAKRRCRLRSKPYLTPIQLTIMINGRLCLAAAIITPGMFLSHPGIEMLASWCCAMVTVSILSAIRSRDWRE
jgi:hypothetical protein